MYCSVEDFRRLLPSTITLGDQNIGTPSPGTPVTKRDKIETIVICTHGIINTN